MAIADGQVIIAQELNQALDTIRSTLQGSTAAMTSVNFTVIDLSGINQDTPLSNDFMSTRTWVPPVDGEIVFIHIMSYQDYGTTYDTRLTIDGNINEPIVITMATDAFNTISEQLWTPPVGTVTSVIAGDNISLTYITTAPDTYQVTVTIGLRSAWTKY